jgi:hypothetical protein
MEIGDLILSGWKEYEVNTSLSGCDRSFFKKFEGHQIELRMWDFTKYGHKVAWDISGNLDNVHIQISLTLDRLEEECQNMLRMFKIAN